MLVCDVMCLFYFLSLTGTSQTHQEIKTKPEEESELQQLRQQLENYRHIVEQQEAFLQVSYSPS